MFLFLYRKVTLVVTAILGKNSPGHVGLSIALGMLIGLMPTDSLLILIFTGLVFVTNVNLLITMIAASGFMGIAPLLDPVSHQLGHFVLTNSVLQPGWLWLYEQPVIPWTRFNNTVVMGNLLVGLFCFYPVCLASKLLLTHHGSRLNLKSVRSWLPGNVANSKQAVGLTGAEE
jgi:uncharacterized protein (TIGR03546 family)